MKKIFNFINSVFLLFILTLNGCTSKVESPIKGLWHRPFSCDYDEGNIEGINELIKNVSNLWFNTIYIEMMIDGCTLYKSNNFETYNKVLNSDYDIYDNDYFNGIYS